MNAFAAIVPMPRHRRGEDPEALSFSVGKPPWSRIAKISARKRNKRLKVRSRRPFHIKISCIGIVWGKLLRNANLCDHMDRKETATETIPVIMRNKMIKKKREYSYRGKGVTLWDDGVQKPPRQVSSSASKPQPRRLVPK